MLLGWIPPKKRSPTPRTMFNQISSTIYIYIYIYIEGHFRLDHPSLTIATGFLSPTFGQRAASASQAKPGDHHFHPRLKRPTPTTQKELIPVSPTPLPQNHRFLPNQKTPWHLLGHAKGPCKILHFQGRWPQLWQQSHCLRPTSVFGFVGDGRFDWWIYYWWLISLIYLIWGFYRCLYGFFATSPSILWLIRFVWK